MSLKLELEKKNIVINEKENDLKVAHLEIIKQLHVAQSLRDNLISKDDALIIATAQLNTIEENKKILEGKLREYTGTLHAIAVEKEVCNDKSNREKELANTIKEKNKALKASEASQKRLAGKLAELENKMNENKTSVDDKYKKANDQVSVKTKEAKKANDDLKKAERRAIELMDTVTESKKKIADIQNNSVTRDEEVGVTDRNIAEILLNNQKKNFEEEISTMKEMENIKGRSAVERKSSWRKEIRSRSYCQD